MPRYRYRVTTPDGRADEGTTEAGSAQDLVRTLRERGFEVTSVDEVGRLGIPQRKKRLTWEDLALFNDQLLAIVKGGLPLAPSLAALAQDLGNKRLRRIIEEVGHDLERGLTLEEAISKHPESFTPVYVSILRAGERTGNLSGVLSLLSAYSGRMVEIKNLAQEAMAYPVVVLAVTCLVVGFLLLRVVPVFEEVYWEFGRGLPAPTQLTINLARDLHNNGLAVAVVACASVTLLMVMRRRALRSRRGRYVLDRLKLRVPGFSRVFKGVSMARFSRSLGLLLGGHVPVAESLDLAAAASGNAVIDEAIQKATQAVARGNALADALAATGVFDHSFCWLLATGESRGEPENALLSLAEAYEREVNRHQRLLATTMGPVVIFAVGLAVGFIVVSLYLPLFSLSSAFL